jgi:hypothetical protein
MLKGIKTINCNRVILPVAVFFCLNFTVGCSVSKLNEDSTYSLKFLDEYIVEDNASIDGHQVGGLSGIDYNGQDFILISDHSKKPVLYKAAIEIEYPKIKRINFIDAVTITCDSVVSFDTESVRYLLDKDQFLIAGEGNANKGHDPIILKVDRSGKCFKSYPIPDHFQANLTHGVRHNGVFEGLSLDDDKTGFWIVNELPLKQDGKRPMLINTNSPVRLTHYQLNASKPDIQFSYDLDRLIKIPLLPFGLNGATELLQLDKNHLLVLERAYSAGHTSKGNRVKIFLVDIANQQDVLNLSSLKKHKSKNLEKTLIFDSKDIRKQLKYKFIDNIEGISFGPDLKNGNKSLILMSDNNFNAFGNQINQFLLLELSKN